MYSPLSRLMIQRAGPFTMLTDASGPARVGFKGMCNWLIFFPPYVAVCPTLGHALICS